MSQYYVIFHSEFSPFSSEHSILNGFKSVNDRFGTKLNHLSFFVKYLYKCQICGGCDIINIILRRRNSYFVFPLSLVTISILLYAQCPRCNVFTVSRC